MSAARITLELPDKLLSAIKRLAAARELTPEAWVREWIVIGISSEILPAEREAPAPPAPPAAALKDWNGVREVAEYLNVSQRHLYNLISGGRLGSVRVGTLVRIKREHVETFLRENTHEARGGQR